MALIEGLRDGRIGRVPVWAAGVGIAAAIILFVVIRNMRKSAGDDAPAGPVDDVNYETVEGIPTLSFADQISGRFPSSGGSIPPHLNRPVTNAQWLLAAFDYLVGLGKVPGIVQRALQDYLAGKSLSAEQQQLIDIVLANSAISLPPEGVTLPEPANPNPNPNPNPGSGGTEIPATVPAQTDTDLYAWSKAIAASYGSHLTFTKLFGAFKGDITSLNPYHRNYMVWVDTPQGKVPKFKPTGVPPVRLR